MIDPDTAANPMISKRLGREIYWRSIPLGSTGRHIAMTGRRLDNGIRWELASMLDYPTGQEARQVACEAAWQEAAKR